MNQQYRIGDQVIVYKAGEAEYEEHGNLKIAYSDGKTRFGEATVPPFIASQVDGKWVIWKAGTVVSANWSFLMKSVTYHVMFLDDNDMPLGSAIVDEAILTPPAAQVLRQADIERLNAGGISA